MWQKKCRRHHHTRRHHPWRMTNTWCVVLTDFWHTHRKDRHRTYICRTQRDLFREIDYVHLYLYQVYLTDPSTTSDRRHSLANEMYACEGNEHTFGGHLVHLKWPCTTNTQHTTTFEWGSEEGGFIFYFRKLDQNSKRHGLHALVQQASQVCTWKVEVRGSPEGDCEGRHWLLRALRYLYTRLAAEASLRWRLVWLFKIAVAHLSAHAFNTHHEQFDPHYKQTSRCF